MSATPRPHDGYLLVLSSMSDCGHNALKRALYCAASFRTSYDQESSKIAPVWDELPLLYRHVTDFVESREFKPDGG